MDRSAPEYNQSGLPSPYPSNFGDNNSEGSTADQPSAGAAQYTGKPEYSSASATATPTSEFYPPSARSGSFPEHVRGSYAGNGATASYPSNGSSGGSMAQQQNSPSMPQSDGRNHQAHGARSDNDVPIDPSIAAASPTYPQHPQHSPYGSDMSHGYQYSGGMYPQPPRPDWGGYGSHAAPLTPGHPMYGGNPASQAPRTNQVCGIA